MNPSGLWRYGLLGAPLAFVSLPLYVTLPHHYAEQFGAPLAALGGVLLATRAADALVDPLIGRWVDRQFRLGAARAWRLAALASAAMALGFAALWHPPVRGTGLLVWLAGCLALTYGSYSAVSVVHQAWGARWGGSDEQRSRVVAAREGAALAGVLVASALPAWAGVDAASALLAVLLAFGLAALLRTAARPPWPGAVAREQGLRAAAAPAGDGALGTTSAAPWSQPAFRALMAVFVVNGLASAIPATLLPFFVADVLRAPQHQPLFLLAYFAAAAAGLPLWVRAVHACGLAAAWRAGMLLAVAAFAVTPLLGAGDVAGYAIVCVASGFALGADLALPAALLAGVVRAAGHAETGEGRYFGWWICAGKLNLALAAGTGLPLLALAGYQAGSTEAAPLAALAAAYGALPLLLKLAAAALLWHAERRHPALAQGTLP